MKKRLLAGFTVCGVLIIANVAQATAVMPDFSSVPAGWVTDRYAPASFANVGTFQGRNDVLGIEISNNDSLSNRPSGYQTTFYNTQGKQHTISGGAGSVLAADLFISSSWADPNNGNVRTDMWGVMTDGSQVTDYPIIGFTNYDGNPRLRIWDDTGWHDLTTAISYNAWTSFAIEFTGTSYDYSVNDVVVYSDTAIDGSTGFQAVIMQAYNFGDPSLTGAIARDYTVNWSNTQPVPEPATMLLLGTGLAGLIGARRKKKA